MSNPKQPKSAAAKRAQIVRILETWLPCRELWRFPLKRGDIFIFSDEESTVLTFYVRWRTAKRESLRLQATRYRLTFQADGANPILRGKWQIDCFRIFVYPISQTTRTQIAALILQSEPQFPIIPYQEKIANALALELAFPLDQR